MHNDDAGSEPPAQVVDATSALDAALSDASAAATDAAARHDSDGPDLCDWLPGGSATTELVFDVVTQTETPLPPLTEPADNILSNPRFDAARMPWIERDECQGLECSYDMSAYRSEVLGAQQKHFVMLVPHAYSVGEDGTGMAGFAMLLNEDAIGLRHGMNASAGVERVRVAPVVMPNDRVDLQLAAMDRWAPEAAAWSLMPAWSPNYDGGYWLDDEVSKQVIEHGLALHVPIFIVEKGMPTFLSPKYSDPVDVGRVAKKYPDAHFIVRHAAFEHGLDRNETSDPDPKDPDADLGWGKGVGQWPEGPYTEDVVDSDEQAKYPLTRGINSLIKSLRDNGIAPNSQNVYVSLDEVWAHLITRPTEAAHALGKLMKYVGEDNILFGTGAMLYGKPDPQVQKFRDFAIPDEMQQRYGYPALTVARKQKILGFNAARLFCSAPR